MAIWANDTKEGDLVEYTSTVTSVREILYRHKGKCKTVVVGNWHT